MNLVFCTYKRIEVFDTLKNLVSFNKHTSFKIVIIDNYGLPNLKSFCENHKMSYFLQEKLGLSVARNTALDLLPNEWVYFFDDDVFFTQEILECLNKPIDPNKIIYSAVYPSCPPIIDGELITGNALSSMSIHNDKMKPIGCSFGFFNDTNVRFDESLGRVGKKLSGGEENSLISELISNQKRELHLLNASIIHRIHDKLSQDYLNNYYLNELRENVFWSFFSFSVRIVYYQVTNRKLIIKKSLIYSLLNYNNENIS